MGDTARHTDSAARRADRESAEREQLRAVGALVGVPVTVTDDESWRLDESGLRVGLGWYAARGHGRDEALVLALLQLWESLRGERIAPERARRVRSIAEARPTLEPLVAAISRLQSAAELLAAFPAMHARLTTAVRRGIGDLAEQPRHLQWVALLLVLGSGGAADAGATGNGSGLAGADAETVEEWNRIAALGSGGGSALRRVLAPDPARSPLDRFERALALLRPPYERLLARDAADRGLGEAPDGAVAQEHEGCAASDDFGAAGGGDAAEQADGESGDDGDAAAPGDDERARPGEGRERAEGADLFAAEQAGFVRTFLATPLPARGAIAEAVGLPELEAIRRTRDDAADGDGGASAVGASSASAADYRGRAAELAPEIERMREVWARVIAERVARVRAAGRRAVPEGETLHPDALASAVAESAAGRARPAAFLRREMRSRRRRRQGSTDYVLLVDRSASMQGRIADAAADAALVMLEALAGAHRDIEQAEQRVGIDLDLDVRTSLVLFDAEVLVLKPLSRGLDDEARRRMHAEIRSPRGSTNDAAALRAAAAQLGIRRREGRHGDGIERRRIAFVLSDGGSNDPRAADRELRRMRAAGVEVHGIGIGSDEVVRRYAPASERIDDPRDIVGAIQRLVESGLA